MRTQRSRSAFTLTELLLVISILSLLMAILLPALSNAKELARRGVCSNQLGSLGKGIGLYAVENKQRTPFPGTKTYPDSDDDPDSWSRVGYNRKYTGDSDDEHLGPQSSNLRALWMLIANEQITPNTVICPSTEDKPDETPINQAWDPSKPVTVAGEVFLDFANASNCSYSYQQQQTGTGGAKGYPTWLQDAGELVIAADRNPLIEYPEGREKSDDSDAAVSKAKAITEPADAEQWGKLNSPNHFGEGQLVLKLGGSVEWFTTPLAGIDKDHIYTVQDTGGSDEENRRGLLPDDTEDPLERPYAPENAKETLDSVLLP